MENVKRLVEILREYNYGIVTVESCTGGALANAITDIPGASKILKSSFITYSDEAKIKLGVPAETIRKYGVYSPETAEAMANIGLEKGSGRPWISVGITGNLPGKAYVAIKTWFTDEEIRFLSVHLTVDTEGERPEAKQVVVDAVIRALLELLETHMK